MTAPAPGSAVSEAPDAGPSDAGHAAAGAAGPMRTRVYAVRRTRRETPDVLTLELEPGVDGEVEASAPGQFNMLYAFGVGEAPISVSGDPGASGRLVHTIRSVGATTRALCGLRRGDPVGVRGPYGTSWPVAEAEGRDVLAVAGGIGLAPLRGAFAQILARRDRYGRVSLLYGARSPRDVVFEEDLRRWRSRFDVEVEITVDHAVGLWRGHVGVVTPLLDYAHVDPDDCVAMLCGPEVMMRHVARDLGRRGVASDRIHVSLERNMECGVGLCGHCQLGGELVCRDGPVFRWDRAEPLLRVREL